MSPQKEHSLNFRDPFPHILGTGTAAPESRYSQAYLGSLLTSKDDKAKAFFRHEHIQTRNLILPPLDPVSGRPIQESTGALRTKALTQSLALGQQAMEKALKESGLAFRDIDYLCCVTSTGFFVPGLSALFIKEFGFRSDCQRADLVGMGCNAGLNGLNSVSSWCRANPGKTGLLVCVEICSAIYSIDDTVDSALVNSLFADGAAALLVRHNDSAVGPAILGFESQILPEFSDALRFDWDNERNHFRFYVSKDTPAALADSAALPLERLMERFGLRSSQVRHWIVHTGGAAILGRLQKKLSLHEEQLRHSFSVLREFGNVSSGSFIFSWERLQAEKKPALGDFGVMMTMGPGLTLELALIRW